jgi:hypothetical protein
MHCTANQASEFAICFGYVRLVIFFGGTGIGVDIQAHRLRPEAETSGNFAFNGSIGLDFQTNEWILLSRLGIFDHNGDGFRYAVWVTHKSSS